MKYLFTIFYVLLLFHGFAQARLTPQESFCKNLNKIFELGRQDNFDSYDGTMVKQSPFLPVPGYSIKLDLFPVTYADKDHRFVGKTNENLDSLSALKKMDEMKTSVDFCLDTLQWSKWSEAKGDDSTTIFFHELTEVKTVCRDLAVTVAVVGLAPKVYSVNLYVKRRR